MTNGEKLKEVFEKDIKWSDTIHIDGIYCKGEWLDAEYKEPTTKNNLGVDCIDRQIISDYVESHIQEINTGYGDLNRHTNSILRMIVDYIEKMPSVTSQEPFLNKPCVSSGVCEHDKNKVLNKIRAKIEPKCDRINSLASALRYPAHREIQELLCDILELLQAEGEEEDGNDD